MNTDLNTDDEEPLLKDIPRDTSGSDEPFFKLPLPDEGEEDYYSDVVVLSRDDSDRVNYSKMNCNNKESLFNKVLLGRRKTRRSPWRYS